MESALQEIRNDNQKLRRELEEVKAMFQNVPEHAMKNLQIIENEVSALKEMTKRQTQKYSNIYTTLGSQYISK